MDRERLKEIAGPKEMIGLTGNEVREMARELLDLQWIPCSERMPEDQQSCLVVVPYEHIRTGEVGEDVFHADYYDEDMTLCEGEAFEEGEYTHWMPLPNPPKEANR